MSISSCEYKCLISSFFSNLGSRNVIAGLYLRKPYKSQASRKEPFTTFNILLNYALEKSCSSHNSVIKVFNLTLIASTLLLILLYLYQLIFSYYLYKHYEFLLLYDSYNNLLICIHHNFAQTYPVLSFVHKRQYQIHINIFL